MQRPQPGRWCELHQRLECVKPRSRNRGECHGPAVADSDSCRMHLGKQAAPVIALAAARQAVATYGLPLDVSPGDALLDEVRYTAGHVAWLREKVRELEDRDLVWGMTEQAEKTATEFKGTDTTFGAVPNVWVDLYMRERKHLVDVAKAAISAGIEERKVRLAEQQGALVAAVIRGILADLKLTPDQRELVAEVVPRRLRALAG